MENNFTNAPQGYGVEPKKKSGAVTWIIIILIGVAGVWYFMKDSGTMSNSDQSNNSAQTLDQTANSSIDGILSDLQSGDAKADASVVDFSDITNADFN